MKNKLMLCGECAELMKEAYELKRVGVVGKSSKCDNCRNPRFCFDFAIAKSHPKGEEK